MSLSRQEQQLRIFDLFPKQSDEVRIKTYSGALISLVAGFCIITLLISELHIYMHPERLDRLVVDTTSRSQKLSITIDITFPHMPCPLLALQTMDVAGTSQLDVEHNLIKYDIHPDIAESKAAFVYTIGQDVPFSQQHLASGSIGNCGRCYGAEKVETQCCNTCEEVQQAFEEQNMELPLLHNFPQCVGNNVESQLNQLRTGYGCRISGRIKVNKVSGNMIFLPGRQFVSEEDVLRRQFDNTDFDMSHTIHTLRFGKSFGESYKPLDGYTRSPRELSVDHIAPPNAIFTYYAKIVPTLYSDTSHTEPFVTNQFSVTEHQKAMGSNMEPEARTSDKRPLYNSAVVLFYELSPIMVHSTLRWQPFLHFITQLCAILGGVFTVAGIVDRLVYGTVQHVQRKVELGKFN